MTIRCHLYFIVDFFICKVEGTCFCNIHSTRVIYLNCDVRACRPLKLRLTILCLTTKFNIKFCVRCTCKLSEILIKFIPIKCQSTARNIPCIIVDNILNSFVQ